MLTPATTEAGFVHAGRGLPGGQEISRGDNVDAISKILQRVVMVRGRVAAEAVLERDVSNSRLQKYQELWDSQHGAELRRQKRVLDILDARVGKYYEMQIFIEEYPIIKRGFDLAVSLIKPLLSI